MRVSTNWLKDFVALKGGAEKVANRLTMAGLEVKKLETCAVTGDILFDVEVTTNRPDWLSHVGVAREISAVDGTSLKMPEIQDGPSGPLPEGWEIQLDEKGGCPFYTGVFIEGLNPGETPGWMKDRLVVCGVRPISLLVDITNYVLLETGQPLHAFDADLLKEKTIIVRRAKKQEKFLAISEDELELTEEDLVIADGNSPIALAGVMGGKLSEVHSGTKNLFLESAFFNPAWIRRSSKRHGLTSESSYRFERRVDPAGVLWASRRAVTLIRQYAKPEKVYRTIGAGRSGEKSSVIRFSPDEISRVVGTRIPVSQMSAYLKSLGLKVSKPSKSSWKVTVPSFRPDLTRPVDLTEEVARLYGFDRIPETIPSFAPIDFQTNKLFDLESRSRSFLAHRGLYESVTFSLISDKGLSKGDLKQAVSIINPQNRELAWMRPVLFTSLLNVVRRNIHLGAKSVPFFEISNIYRQARPKELPEQERTVGIALCGQKGEKNWLDAARDFTYYDLRGLLDGFFELFSPGSVRFEPIKKDFLRPDGAMEIVASGKPVGYLGQIGPDILKIWDLDQPVFYAELFLNRIIDRPSQGKNCEEISKYPASERDLSVVVPENTKSGQICEKIMQLSEGLITKIALFDLFRGGRIPKGHKNFAFRLTYQSFERTLTSEEVQSLHSSIAEKIVKQFQATFQS